MIKSKEDTAKKDGQFSLELQFNLTKSEVVDEIICFIAPKIFGGKAKSPVEGLGISKIEEAYKLSLKNLEMLGGDVMIGYKVCKKY